LKIFPELSVVDDVQQTTGHLLLYPIQKEIYPEIAGHFIQQN
jgi:hypothetical protein